MYNLIDSFDSYNDFNRNTFFTICFDSLPSNLDLNLSLKGNRANMESIMPLFNLSPMNLKTVFKNWNTKDVKGTDGSEDFVNEYLLKSETHKLIVWISLDDEELFIDFLYDMADQILEAWIMKINHDLRAKYGKEQSPTFKVLSRGTHSFFTEDVNTGNFETTDVNTLYNDDFQEVDSIIVNAIGEDRSGLILLHGTPGTGKTSYIKSLISKFKDKSFIFIQNEFVRQLLRPDFVSFLLKHRNAILVIEDAEKIIMSRETSNEGSVVSTILQLTDGLFSDYLNIKIICTFNSSMEKVDKALLRKGRMIANYEFKPLTKEKSSELSLSLGFESTDKEMTLADIFKQKEKSFVEASPVKIGF